MKMQTYTKEFRTRSFYQPVKNLHKSNMWPVAVDIGYSAVKGMSPNAVYCIPSYARETDDKRIGKDAKDDILYRDEKGTTWLVGNSALATLKNTDTKDSMSTLYGRYRYFNPMFRVLVRVAIAVGAKGNKILRRDNKSIFLQTGLPSGYLEADASYIKEAIVGHHKFSVKLGRNNWCDYEFIIDEDSVDVMDQAMGAVFSASKDDNGITVLEENGRSIVEEKILVCDGGFGTMNAISIYARQIDTINSFDDLGMKDVLALLASKLNAFGIDRKVHTMQPVLEEGSVYIYDRSNRSTKQVEIAELLRESSDDVMRKATNRLDVTYNYLQDFVYLLLSGGTCAAWLPGFQEHYSGMDWLKIITSDRNDQLGPVFSNVRGYYLYRELALQAMEKRAGGTSRQEKRGT